MISLYHIVKCETVTGSHTASAVCILQGTKQFWLNYWKLRKSSRMSTFYSVHPILIDAAGRGGGVGLRGWWKRLLRRYCLLTVQVLKDHCSYCFWNNKSSCNWVLVQDWCSAGRQVELRKQLRWKLLQPMQINANADVNLNTCKEADTKDINP